MADNIKKGNTLQTAASKPHGGIALYRDILSNVLETVSENKDTDKIQKIQETSENNSILEDAGNAEKLEHMWDERIRDYISEHYPTQATVSAATMSEEGIAERERMQQDEELKRMVEQSKAEIDAAIREEERLVKQDAEKFGQKNVDEKMSEAAQGGSEKNEMGGNLFQYFTGTLSELISQAKQSA